MRGWRRRWRQSQPEIKNELYTNTTNRITSLGVQENQETAAGGCRSRYRSARFQEQKWSARPLPLVKILLLGQTRVFHVAGTLYIGMLYKDELLVAAENKVQKIEPQWLNICIVIYFQIKYISCYP